MPQLFANRFWAVGLGWFFDWWPLLVGFLVGFCMFFVGFWCFVGSFGWFWLVFGWFLDVVFLVLMVFNGF